MKHLKTLIVLLFVQIAAFAQAQNTEWLETKGTIINIEKLQFQKKSLTRATVTYSIANDTATYQGKVDMVRLPFVGSFQSVGDEIKIVASTKVSSSIPMEIQLKLPILTGSKRKCLTNE